MDLNLAGMSIPVSGLNCFDTLSILVLVPVFDGVRDDDSDSVMMNMMIVIMIRMIV
jgi:hypothetical protein